MEDEKALCVRYLRERRYVNQDLGSWFLISGQVGFLGD